MSVKIIRAIKELLVDGDDLDDGDLAAQILDAVERLQGEARRIITVGQIYYDGSEKPYTVALGPYSARGKLDTPEKWEKAAGGHTASREDGGRLAWDTSTKLGKGRFMVVPILRSARDAWDFFRGSELEPVAEILAGSPDNPIFETSIRGDSVDVGPVCTCGLRESSGHQNVMGVKVTKGCMRHPVNDLEFDF